MPSILTEHIRHFGTPAADNGFLAVVSRILRARMRRQGLFQRAPMLLGYADLVSWRDEGALDEPTQDAYLFAVVQRIAGLKRALSPERDIDPLVVRNISCFLAERQREHNPIGYAVFQNVRAAAGLARKEGWLSIDRQPRQAASSSLLRFAGVAAPPVDAGWVAAWVEARTDLKQVGLALSSCGQQAQVWLFERLRELRDAGTGPIRLGDLVAALERQARDAWPTNAPPPSETVSDVTDDRELVVVRLVRPDASIDDRDHLTSLIARAGQALSELPQQQKVHQRRQRVLQAVVRQVEESDGAPLRQVDLARELGINQATLFRDLEAIREILARLSAEMKK